nr:hypothetical protein CFP56_31511 [Quercus suber]
MLATSIVNLYVCTSTALKLTKWKKPSKAADGRDKRGHLNAVSSPEDSFSHIRFSSLTSIAEPQNLHFLSSPAHRDFAHDPGPRSLVHIINHPSFQQIPFFKPSHESRQQSGLRSRSVELEVIGIGLSQHHQLEFSGKLNEQPSPPCVFITRRLREKKSDDDDVSFPHPTCRSRLVEICAPEFRPSCS